MGRGIVSWSDCLIGILLIILFLMTLLLNVLAVHYIHSKIRRPSNKKIPHLLVGALSLAGLGIALFEYPPFIASRFQGDWLYDSGVCSFVAFVIVLFGNLTICLVVLMSLERLGAIVFPFFYKEHVNFRKAVIILLVVAGYSILLAMLPLILDRIRLNVSTGVCTYAVDSHNTNTRIVVAVMVSHYIASLVVMFVSNMVVLKTVSKLDRKSMPGEYSNRSGERKHGTNACINFAKMVGVLAFFYTICWTFILMRILLLYVYGWRNGYYDQVVIVLTTFDPLINHCVCLWIMRKYRDGYVSSMGSLLSCFKISDDGIWATTMTRLSTMSRRSTYSRASTRSSSRQPSKPYVYKQVPQNAENIDKQPDVQLVGEAEFQEQPNRFVPDNGVKLPDSQEKQIYSDTKKELSEIIRELKADEGQTKPTVQGRADEILPIAEESSSHETRKMWQCMVKKVKQEKDETPAPRQLRAIEVHQEKPQELTTSKNDAKERCEEMGTDGKESSAKESQEIQGEKVNNVPNEYKSNDKKNLPELLQEIEVGQNEEKPELLRDGSAVASTPDAIPNIPELLQDISLAKHDAKEEETSAQVSEVRQEDGERTETNEDSPETSDGKEKKDGLE